MIALVHIRAEPDLENLTRAAAQVQIGTYQRRDDAGLRAGGTDPPSKG
jgi:hypothetical protein